MEKIKEECGVFGICCNSTQDVAASVYYGLFALQHRGQESCGIVVNDDGIFNAYKDLGLVNDVFTPAVLDGLGKGNMAVGHVRYSTTGGGDRNNAQPIVVNHVKGSMALAHNGNLVNSAELREELELCGSIFHTTSDTEVICYVITKERLNAPSIEEAVNRAMNRIRGAYSLCIMSPSKLIAARDPHGFRPLCYGRTGDGSYAVASESCALDAVGAKLIRDVEPGEIVVFDKSGVRSIRDHCGKADPALCAFEYFYFARPDSVIGGVCVQQARINAGRMLARQHPVDADVVVGVPDSGLDAAIGYAKESGIPFGLGLLKNKYIGRTFIAPGQKAREDRVRIKLNPIPETVRGKRVVLIDDTLVRGTTSKWIVRLVREAGAAEVHVRISSPPFIDACYYGTDIDSKENLIANNHTLEEITRIIGADSLGYLDPASVSVLTGRCDGKGFCTACFDGRYPTEIPRQTGKNRFERKIIESEKSSKSIFYKETGENTRDNGNNPPENAERES